MFWQRLKGYVPYNGIAVAAAWMVLLASTSSALPPGRAWAPVVPLQCPGIQYLVAPRFDTDATGTPYLMANVAQSNQRIREWAIIPWGDTTWAEIRFTGVHASRFPERAVTFDDRTYTVWLDYNPWTVVPDPYLLFSELTTSGLTPPDTVAKASEADSEYGAAVGGRRRWVVRSEPIRLDRVPCTIWLRYSDTLGIWHTLPNLGVDDPNCAVAALDSNSAIVAYCGIEGLSWAIASGDRWVAHGTLDPRPWRTRHPRFRVRPSGGLWLSWSEINRVHVGCYRDGAWSYGDSIVAIHRPGEAYQSGWLDLSRDPGERPAIAWDDLGANVFRDVGCVAIPYGAGWAGGEEIPGSEGLYLTPQIARDRNGDVWTVWRRRGEEAVNFTHTYCRVTVDSIWVEGAGRHRRVHWVLSEPAAETWWAVLCSRNGGPFEVAARVQAGLDLQQGWTDDSPPAGVLRYRIRRESVDKRFEWESAEVQWPAKSQRPFRALTTSRSAENEVEVALEDAAVGPVTLRLYDIQGRLVTRREARALGVGREVLHLDLTGFRGRLPSGVYFLRVTDAVGLEAEPARVVVLR